MTRDELIRFLDTTLSQAADGPPVGPRPQGTFVGNSPPDGAHSTSSVDGPCGGLKKQGGRRVGSGSPASLARNDAMA